MTNTHSSKIEDFVVMCDQITPRGTLIDKLPEGKDLPFELDPDKRDWKYDGDGRKIPKSAP